MNQIISTLWFTVPDTSYRCPTRRAQSSTRRVRSLAQQKRSSAWRQSFSHILQFIQFFLFSPEIWALYPVNITVLPSYSFSEEDPWVFQEDKDCRSHTSVQRPRMFPEEQLPAVPVLQQPSAQQPVDVAAVQDIHDSTGRYLQQVRGQPQPPATSSTVYQATVASPSPGTSSAAVDLSSLLSTDRTCPVCQATFQELNKLKRHITTRHSRESPFMCTKCKKNLGSASSLATHMETFINVEILFATFANFPASSKKKSPST